MKLTQLLGLLLLVGGSRAEAQDFPFVEDTSSVLVGELGGWLGAFWGDAESDGDLDLLLTEAYRNDRLFWNQGAGQFLELQLTVSPHREVNGGGWADVDRNGLLDFVAGSIAGSAMLLNTGNPEAPFLHVPLAFEGDRARDIVVGDYDRDGDPDLAVVKWGGGLNLMYRNVGFGFTVGQSLSEGADGTTACWGDFDDDGWPDLFLANATGFRSVLFRNDNGVLVEEIESAPSAEQGNAQGCGWADYDGDGDADLYVARAGYPGDPPEADGLFRNDGGVFTDTETGPIVTDEGRTFGSAWGDVDNDGDLDLAVVNRDGPDALYINAGAGEFSAIPFGDTADGWSLSATLVDDDEDGDLDLFTTHGSYAGFSRNRLFRNTTDTLRHWLQVDLRSVDSDRFGLGARAVAHVTIDSVARVLRRDVSGRSGRMAQDGFRLHFGLGDATMVDSLVITWPTNGRQVVRDLAADQVVVLHEEEAPVAGESDAPEHAPELRVQPNPAVGAFVIVATGVSDGPLQAEVIDLLGRRITVVQGNAVGGAARLHMGQVALPAGQYLIRLVGTPGVVTRVVVL